MERRGRIREVTGGADAARVPPHDLDAERAVIGAMLVSESAVAAVAESISAEDFYSETHRVLYRAMMRLYSKGEPIDQLTLLDELRGMDQADRVGGRAYIFQLVESVPTAANAARYAEIVRGKALLRAIIDAGSRIADDAFREPEDVNEALDAAEQLVYSVSNRTLRERLAPVSELAPGALEMIQRLYESEGEVTGVETGFNDLDKLTTGFHKSDLVVLAARPAMGKCLSADAEISLSDGSVATIEEVFKARRGRLLTLGDDLKFRWTEPTAFVDDGVKPVFKVTTRLGRTIETTLTHPFLTVEGWRKLGQLSVGDRIAVPRRMPVFGNKPLGAHRVRLLAYLLGDGDLGNTCPRFTNANPAVREDFVAAVREFGGLSVSEDDSGGTRTPALRVSADRVDLRRHRTAFARELRQAVAEAEVPAGRIAARLRVSPASLTNWCAGKTVPDATTGRRLNEMFSKNGTVLGLNTLDRARKNAPNALTRWLEELGLKGRRAKDKFVPDAVFRAPREELALFLNRIFATDGWATVLATGQAQLGYCTVSEKLARQVQHLLLRFGVVAALRERLVKYGDSRREAYQLNITDPESIRNFAEEIGIFGKEEAVRHVIEALEHKRPHINRDLVPSEAWRLVDEARRGESWRALARRMGFGPGHNFHVGKRALSRDRIARFAGALGDGLLQNLAESDVYWDEIVAIEPLGEQQVYDLTIPETHNFVANDICVHNTAFALNAIWHAAGVEELPVAIFSLEMSKEQLVQRLISQTTRIPTQDLRSGNVRAEDWPKLVRGVAEVSRAPIWIDDTAGINLMEMRAKVRRLASRLNAQDEKPLSLVVVDYLQLMIGNSRENRQQEIAEISRGLKVLARDLNVPVLAIAQLSRAVEQRHDKRPLLSDLRDCVVGDTSVQLADGRRVPIRELVGTTPELPAVDAAGKLISASSEMVWKVGKRPVWTVRFASGRSITATAEHRLLTFDGYREIEDLEVGDRIATPRYLPEPLSPERWPDDRVALLGHLIGDGSYLSGQPIRYTTASEECSELVSRVANEQFGCKVSRHKGHGNWHQLVISGNGNRWHPAGVNKWLRELGIFDRRSAEKRVPEAAFRLSNEQVGLLLAHLWATDGTIGVYSNGKKGFVGRASFSTCSEGLAEDVQALLLRLGVSSRIRRVRQKESRWYQVAIEGVTALRAFADDVGAFAEKKIGLKKVRSWLGSIRSNTNIDTVPVEVFDVVRSEMRRCGVSHRTMSAMRGTSYNGSARFRFSPSRATVAEYAGRLNSQVLLDHATSDLFWDRVVSIEAAGEQEVYDLTVPGPSCWIANGIVSHNSGAIEQDADMVMFLYRDEYYNPDSEDKGIAEVIVGKHRNGPTGKTQLAWLEQYTKFASLARR